jgi:predicted nucleic acid-binding Zn ribbon protein
MEINNNSTKANRSCAQCGSVMTGRVDKKFCSDQCRATASNRRKDQDRGEQLIKDINYRLRRNRFLLQRFSPEGKTTLRREVLEQAGFDFRYFTHLYRTQKGNTYYFCYDYGYLLLEEEKVLIVNWQPYMERS